MPPRERNMSAIKLLGIIAAMALVGAAAFAIGGRRGFNEGYVVGSHTVEVVSAGLLLHTQAAHDRGECEEGRRTLELMVDGALISDWAYHQSMTAPPFYTPRDAYEVNLPKVLHLLAQYRTSHPREIPEPGASAVQATLTRLAAETTGN